MESDNNFDRIEKYLDGTLSGNERKQFEAAMERDNRLKQALEFQLNIEKVLASQPVDALQVNLKQLDQKYASKEDEKGGSKGYIWIGIGMLLLLLVAYWGFQDGRKDSPIQTEVPEESTTRMPQTPEETQPNLDTIQEDGTKETQELSPPNDQPTKQEAPVESEKKSKQKESRPIASNFQPNELLESRISTLRGNSLVIKEHPSSLTKTAQGLTLKISGTFTSTEEQNASLNLYIFNNQVKDYEDFKPVFSHELSLEQKEGSTWSWRVVKDISLSPGLYYYQIESEDGEILYLDKLSVEE